MKTLHLDELFLLAVELSLPDLFNLCSTSKQINSSICQNEKFWLFKLNKDFPDWYLDAKREIVDPVNNKIQILDNLNTFKEKYILLHHIRSFAKLLVSKLEKREIEFGAIYNLLSFSDFKDERLFGILVIDNPPINSIPTQILLGFYDSDRMANGDSGFDVTIFYEMLGQQNLDHITKLVNRDTALRIAEKMIEKGGIYDVHEKKIVFK